MAGTRRLLIISLTLILWVGFAVFGLRQLGLQQEFAPLKHSLLSQPQWLIVFGQPGDEYSIYNEIGRQKIRELPRNVMLQIELRPTFDDQWVAYGPKYLVTREGEQIYPETKTLAQLEELELEDPQLELHTLESILAMNFSRPLVFVLHSNRTLMIEKFQKLIGQLSSKDQILVRSPYITTLKVLRENEPFLLYGADSATKGKLQLLTGLYLETLPDVKADFFIARLNNYQKPSFSQRMVQELNRRKIRAVLETDSLEEFAKVRDWGIDSVVTSRPALFVEQFTSKP